MKIIHNGSECEVVFTNYADGNTAICLTQDGVAYATATINDPDFDLLENEVIIKNYSENEGILEALEEAGIVQSLYPLSYGFTTAIVCKVLKK